MDVKITNIYSNIGQPEKNLKGAYGNGFFLEFGNEKMLFDLGWKGKVLLHNLNELNINIDEIHSEKKSEYQTLITLSLDVPDHDYLIVDRFVDRVKINL